MENEQKQNIEQLPAQPAILPTPEPKKDGILKSKWLILGIVAVVLIAGIGGAYLLGKNNATPKTTTITQNSTSTPTITPNPTTDWQTYKGNGFLLKYPKDWTFKADDQNNISIYPPGSDPNLPGPLVSIAYRNDDFKSYKTLGGIVPSPITIDNITGVEHEDPQNFLPPRSYYAAFPLNSGTLYLTSDVELESQAKQILSTFKFIISASGPNLMIINTTYNGAITMEAPTGSTFTKPAPNVELNVGSSYDITYNGSVFHLLGAPGGRDGPCPYDPNQTSLCTYDDTYPSLKKGLSIHPLRVWRDNNGVFMLNPQEITVGNQTLNNIQITKISPNKIFTSDEVSTWENQLNTISAQ